MRVDFLLLAALALAAPLAVSACEKAPPTPVQAQPNTVQASPNQPQASPGTMQAAASAAATPKLLPRFVDIGTTTCVPCRVMLEVMQELEAGYATQLKIEFVNMKQDPQTAEKLGVRTIPTQVFFSPGAMRLVSVVSGKTRSP